MHLAFLDQKVVLARALLLAEEVRMKINKKAVMALLIISVSFSVYTPAMAAQLSAPPMPSPQELAQMQKMLASATSSERKEMEKELAQMKVLLKEKLGEAVALSNEIQVQQRAGLPAVIVDQTIGSLLDVLRVIVGLFAAIFNGYGWVFGLPLFMAISRSLTKDIKQGTLQEGIKKSFNLYDYPSYSLPYLSSGKLSPNILNISLAHTERQKEAIAALKEPGKLSAIQKGLRGALFMLDRIGTYAKVPPKFVATVLIFAFIAFTSAISAVLYIPGTLFAQLYNALTYLRKKVAVEPSDPEIELIGS